MALPTIRSVSITGIHGHQNISVKLKPGLNVIHGINGSGKTTLLHILANILDKDIERFCYIRFERIVITTDDNTELALVQEGEAIHVIIDHTPVNVVKKDEPTPLALVMLLRERLGGRPVYLPAFRTVLEGGGTYSRAHRAVPDTFGQREEYDRIIRIEEQNHPSDSRRVRPMPHRERMEQMATKTVMCRNWFGPFVPLVRYPSLGEILREIESELQRAHFQLSSTDQLALSSVFVRVLEAIFDETPELPAGDIQSMFIELRSKLEGLSVGENRGESPYRKIAEFFQRPLPAEQPQSALIHEILNIYDRALSDRAQVEKRAFEAIRTFEKSVNQFLHGKKLSISDASFGVQRRSQLVELIDGKRYGLSVLSSGERHVVTLLFSATHMSSTDGSVLIDEPELSLHVDWQRLILSELKKQAGERQIISCTHSPEVVADHQDCLVDLKSEPYSEPPDLFSHDSGSVDFDGVDED